uniref:HSF-type DNA-binding domain-containing protein n=1 Tax=Setaria digitata TaxID=48799 RepID=A0A915PI54_9BILA
MQNTVTSDNYTYRTSPATPSFMRTLLCGTPLFSDPKFRPSNKIKSTQFCNYTPLSSSFKHDKVETSIQETSGKATIIHKSQPSVSVNTCQNGGYRNTIKHYFPNSGQKGNGFMFEIDQRLSTKSDFYESNQVQQYYEKLMCQLTMSNSTLMRENQRYQVRFKHLRMLLEDHIDHLNNIYFTLFLNGFNAIQFPDGQKVNLAEFQGTKLKLIPRTNVLSTGVISTTSSEDLLHSHPHNNNGSSLVETSSIKASRESDVDNQLSDGLKSSRSVLLNRDDDIEGYLQWMNGQATAR